MIWLYSGTPRSGKSYHAMCDILEKVKRKDKNTVIANFPVVCGKYSKNFIYLDNEEITIDYLVKYAFKNHKPNVEGQTLVVIDEAGLKFNCRDGLSGSTSKIRMAWLTFFSQHGKLGYNFILVSQSDKQLDKQIRLQIEYEVVHKKINNYAWFLPMTTFIAVEKWYSQKMRMSHKLIFYNPFKAKKYDSYAMFDVQYKEYWNNREV